MFSRLEARDILAHIDKDGVDPDVLAKLVALSGSKQTLGAATTSGWLAPSTHLDQREAGDGSIPPFIPVVYSKEQLARIKVPEGDGFRPATQADVDAINQIKKEAHAREWDMRHSYKANLNQHDVVNAVFDAPDRDRGFSPVFEEVLVGKRNLAGDECVSINADGMCVFRCTKAGHGYTQSRSLRSCSACFLTGTSHEQNVDPGELAGSDSRW